MFKSLMYVSPLIGTAVSSLRSAPSIKNVTLPSSELEAYTNTSHQYFHEFHLTLVVTSNITHFRLDYYTFLRINLYQVDVRLFVLN